MIAILCLVGEWKLMELEEEVGGRRRREEEKRKKGDEQIHVAF